MKGGRNENDREAPARLMVKSTNESSLGGRKVTGNEVLRAGR